MARRTAIELIEICGEDGARALAQAMGGKNWWVSADLDTALARFAPAGEWAATEIWQRCHGTRLCVPTLRSVQAAIRQRQIREALRWAGCKVVARQMGLTPGAGYVKQVARRG